jgi:hypothetical protein
MNLRIVCTDRGTHPDEFFCQIELDDNGNVRPTVPKTPARSRRGRASSLSARHFSIDEADPWQMLADPRFVSTRRADGGFTVTFPCKRCGRTPALRDDTLAQLCARLTEERIARIDISYC